MRSLYRNNFQKEGFIVRALKKNPNTEKLRVRNVLGALHAAQPSRTHYEFRGDSGTYYRRILSEPDEFSVAGAELPGDSIAFAADSVTVGLYFPDYLLITYTYGKVPAAYRDRFPENGKKMTSEITLINGRPVEIKDNGMYYAATDLLSIGWWGWWKKWP
jgi:hypothetical protein